MPLRASQSQTRVYGHRTVFSATIIVAIGATILAALLIAGFGVYWATHESDAVSVQRQVRTAQRAMGSAVDELGLQQGPAAGWDESIARILAEPRDMAWLHEYFGIWLNKIFRHDETFILDGYDRPIYAARDGNEVPAGQY